MFYDTVHTVAAQHYSPDQLDAWATGSVDLRAWDASFLQHDTVVAVENGCIIGFADMDKTGYLDRLYVHKHHQGRGVATCLCDELENRSDARVISTHASITARPFFEKRGYRAIKEQQVQRHGVVLVNYAMEKQKDKTT